MRVTGVSSRGSAARSSNGYWFVITLYLNRMDLRRMFNGGVWIPSTSKLSPSCKTSCLDCWWCVASPILLTQRNLNHAKVYVTSIIMPSGTINIQAQGRLRVLNADQFRVNDFYNMLHLPWWMGLWFWWVTFPCRYIFPLWLI